MKIVDTSGFFLVLLMAQAPKPTKRREERQVLFCAGKMHVIFLMSELFLAEKFVEEEMGSGKGRPSRGGGYTLYSIFSYKKNRRKGRMVMGDAEITINTQS